VFYERQGLSVSFVERARGHSSSFKELLFCFLGELLPLLLRPSYRAADAGGVALHLCPLLLHQRWSSAGDICSLLPWMGGSRIPKNKSFAY
jgi:hypothetical protein